ncbi:glycosyltransferase [Desulfohalobium retbaense]|uniref:Glycosyl transferase group 1 n=1 Tax=Desulfohalobium retbaense (strain ATCC 49708 / DSM 5692 / JCM 16813 / HR100) TaxID=485915 RepID=C8X4Q0_DESRD|nr:glycosyltransferase [Desulfohalobium retbaense]ACV69273.1 glycosyl transferase group 1 [Desulfohalobium retbaense DSM 5692]
MSASMQCDLHVHSKFSKRPSQWILQKINCPESFTEPKRLYDIARQRGMDLVTITDHNTLAGSLEIAHLDNTFVSEEITTYFPEDRCKLHVLAYHVTEAQHEDISRLRDNVFDLVPYLREQAIFHVLAHPLFAVNDRLTLDHVEQTLLLFKYFEINGARDASLNVALRHILDNLTPERIEHLAEKHDLAPLPKRPWEKYYTGGSDDHSSLNIARTHTTVDGVTDLASFWAGVEAGQTRINDIASKPQTMAHNLYGIAYQFYRSKFNLGRHAGKDSLLQFADAALTTEEPVSCWWGKIGKVLSYKKATSRFFQSESPGIEDVLQREARQIIADDPRLQAMLKQNGQTGWDNEDKWYEFVRQAASKVAHQFGDSILDSLTRAKLFNVFKVLGSAGSLYTLLAPYFVAYTMFSRDRLFSRECCEQLVPQAQAGEETPKVLAFTDTYDDVNGVALTLQMQVELARQTDKDLSIVTCGAQAKDEGVIDFDPIGTFQLDEYPELAMTYPPFLEMLDYCFENGVTHLHACTPGPVGLAALGVAKILHLPIYGTYHTAFPQYMAELTGDTGMEDMTWKYMTWFYNQMDLVYVPSKATGDELAARGVEGDRLRTYPRGIDVERFHPQKRNGFWRSSYAISDEKVKLLYVGRISKEKNLTVLTQMFQELTARRADLPLELILVGDGPYLAEMRRELRGLPVTFTGVLHGEELAQAYASSDLFVFPSTTDTFGNVVLEAQASGIPVLVSDQGGPQENIDHGETGFIIPGAEPGEFARRVEALADDPERLRHMQRAARDAVADRSFTNAFLQSWHMFAPTREVPAEQTFATAS